MAAIDAKMIKELRDKTGMGITDCKKALEEAQGDVAQAEMLLRKRQTEKAIKKADRPTGEGVIAIKIDGDKAAMVEVACEQEPTKNNERFVSFVDGVMDAALASSAKDAEMLLAAKFGAETVQDALTALAGTVGENVQVKRALVVDAPSGGMIGTYAHFNKKAGAMICVELDGADAGNAELQQAANDVCMHAVAMRPVALNRSDVPADLVEKEKEVFRDQIKDKPENIQDKILEGKLGKFYSEKCLLEQIFAKDPEGKMTVQQVIDNAAKAAGGKATITSFARFELGVV